MPQPFISFHFCPFTETPLGCDTEPSTHIIQLPEDCVQAATNKAEYDVGKCDTRTRCTGDELEDQTSCHDTESSCCQKMETREIDLQCQGYNLPISQVISCGCAQCSQKPIKIIGKVVSSGPMSPILESITVYYNNEIVTSTDSNGQFAFTFSNAVTRVALTFRDLEYSRVLETTMVFRVDPGSPTYAVVKMTPVDKQVEVFDSMAGKRLSTALATMIIPENSVYTSGAREIYNGSVHLTLGNFDMTNRIEAELAPGSFTAIDEDGERVSLLAFGMFALQLTDPLGNHLLATGITIILNSEVNSESGYDTKLWVLNRRSGNWELASELIECDDFRLRRKRQVTRIVGHLNLFEFEWYAIGDIDRKKRCWAKVISYGSSDFIPSSVLPASFQVTAVLREPPHENQSLQNWYYRVSSASSITSYGSVGLCVPLACNTNRFSDIEAFLSTTLNAVYLDPANPIEDGPYHSLKQADRELVTYYISNHRDSEIWMKPKASDNSPIYFEEDAGSVRGKCSQAGSQDKHFQFSCDFCNDVVCNTYQSDAVCLTSRTFRTFYPFLLPSSQTKQPYCSVGIRVYTNSLALNVTVTSTNNNGKFYGRRDIVARKPEESVNRYIDACMEYKCSGKVYEGKLVHSDVTKVIVDVKDNDGQMCTVQKMAAGFQMDSQTQTPIHFNDPLVYGENTGVHKYYDYFTQPVCLNDLNSPQTTTTDNCQINGMFVPAVEIRCI